ncbi:MAG: 16S rRNA (cytosine(1402)-N(4))-methyltransferase RsmH [Gemmataceae bacterium]
MSDPIPVRHQPVLPAEVRQLLAPATGEIWVDATTGGGGHTRIIAEAVGPAGRVLALDRDPHMLELARPRLAGLPVTLVHASFDQLADVLAARGVATVDGVLADLGFSSDQLEDPRRGLSFQQDGPLDMRLDPTRGETAAQLLARINERDLANLIFEFGEERFSRRIAKKVVETRRTQPIHTTAQLAELVRGCVPRSKKSPIDPATRTFQALRIAVNDELAVLEALLAQLPRVVRRGGRVGLISFHSLEDRRVKQALRDPEVWDVQTRKPVQPGDEEVRRNSRSRSAKLRVAVRH